MAKTVFQHGTIPTPEFFNAINSPTYSASPSEDGQIPYPDIVDSGVAGAINLAIGSEQHRAEEEELALAEAVQALEASAATTSGNNAFSGQNAFSKTPASSVSSVGDATPGVTSTVALSLDSPGAYRLIGGIIFLTGYLAQVNKMVRFIISNPSGFTWGVDVPVVAISAVGDVVNHGSGFEYLTSVKLAEIIWDGSTVWVKQLTV